MAGLLAVHGGGDGVGPGPRRRHRLRAGQAALVGPPGGLRGVGACRGHGQYQLTVDTRTVYGALQCKASSSSREL